MKITKQDTGLPAEREIAITNRYLYIPVQDSSSPRKIVFQVDGKPVHYSTMRLSDDNKPEFQASIDVGEFIGKTLTVKIDRLPEGSLALSSMTQGDVIPDADSIYHEKYRPQFHFSAGRGWLNDPNGLVFYKGEYHLFFQHNPTGLGSAGFNMHWGHAVSPDLLHWKELPIAIAPTPKENSIWSGSALVDWNNTSGLQDGNESPLIALYTVPYSQYLAYSNDRGRTWTRYEKNPVLPLIANAGRDASRDPKVTWHDGTKRWVMALYLANSDFGLYTSPDLKQWTEVQKLTLPGCLECPDYFPMAVDGKPNTWVFVAGNGRYLIGDFDGEKFSYNGQALEVDFGLNCYAVQTYSDIPEADGRRIQIGWMSGPRYPDMPYSGQMSFPCELTLHQTAEGLRLFKYPVAEIGKLHRNSKHWKDVSLVPGANLLKGINGDLFDISVEIEIGSANEIGFVVRGIPVRYDVAATKLTGLGEATMQPDNGRIKLRLLVDRTSLEVFGNDGTVAITSRCLPEDDDRGLEIFAKGGTARVIWMEVHEVESAWSNIRAKKTSK